MSGMTSTGDSAGGAAGGDFGVSCRTEAAGRIPPSSAGFNKHTRAVASSLRMLLRQGQRAVPIWIVSHMGHPLLGRHRKSRRDRPQTVQDPAADNDSAADLWAESPSHL